MKKLLPLLALTGMVLVAPAAVRSANPTKPRIVVMTDSEVDDRCSMVHLLLCANDVDIAALIQTNSCFQLHGWSHEHWLERQIDHYAEVYPNLKVHSADYPTPEELRQRVYVGDEDSTHIPKGVIYPMIFPGQEPMIDPSTWPDTPGSDRIVEILLDDDPRTVHIQAWGGGNTAAKAFQKIKDQYPDQYDHAMAKVVMYNIWYQDAAGSYIERHHPGVTLLLSHHFNGTWNYGSQRYTRDLVERLMHNGHGPLAADYMQDYISEGDSPSFFYSLDNGLRSDEDPTYGGWGGRFYKVDGFEHVYRDVSRGTYTEWTEAVLRDFEMRLKWCVSPTYEEANHKPVITIAEGLDLSVHSGDEVTLTAQLQDFDKPDLDALWDTQKEVKMQAGMTKEDFIASWEEQVEPLYGMFWQYYEAGTCPCHVDLRYTGLTSIAFTAPEVSEPQTLHFIYEVADQGDPALTSYARVIVSVLPRD